MIIDQLDPHLSSAHIEVQERASTALMVLKLLKCELTENSDGFEPEEECIKNVESVIVEAQLLETVSFDPMETQNPVVTNGKETEKNEIVSKSNIPPNCRELILELAELFSGELNPVAPKAQRKVQIPDG